MGEMTIWYNSNTMKMDPKLYEGHKYGHWEQILKEIKCLPLKTEQKSMFVHLVQVATEYKAEKVDDKVFVIPEFKSIIDSDALQEGIEED